jgi:hypothetical protein
VALVRERTVPTERLSHVGKVSANFCGYRVSRGQPQRIPTAVFSDFQTGAAIFLPSSSSVELTGSTFFYVTYINSVATSQEPQYIFVL